VFPLTEQGLLTKQCEKLIDISTDTGLRDTYTNIPLISFWTDVKKEFLHPCGVAVKKLFLFPPTYLFKTAFLRYPAANMRY
jgi:hypothetical protein